MIVKPLQIRGGMQAQVQLSAAALEDDALRLQNLHCSSSQPFHSQLCEILTFES